MSDLIKQVRPFLKYVSKAKAAKLVRGLVDMFLDMDREGSNGEAEVQLCKVSRGQERAVTLGLTEMAVASPLWCKD
jgi:hypothetical protein